jgi:hypothetical protein
MDGQLAITISEIVHDMAAESWLSLFSFFQGSLMMA